MVQAGRAALFAVYLVTDFLNDLLFIFQRVNWLSAIDILLVTLIFFILLYTLRDTQALVLLRGVLFLVVLLALLTSLVELPGGTIGLFYEADNYREVRLVRLSVEWLLGGQANDP